jgi:hypothetical protein
MRYAIVKDGIIQTLIEWDGVTAWEPPEGATVYPFPDGPAESGWIWNDGAPADPNAPKPKKRK